MAPDGAKLGYTRYRAHAGDVALVYLHGIESHALWFDAAARLLAGRGYDVFCMDRRGSGVNGENRGFVPGHVDSFRTLLADIHAFVRPLRSRCKAVFLVGLSWGGKLALGHSLAYPRDADGLVLIVPGIRAVADVGLTTKLRILLTAGLLPRTRISLPLTPEMFTDDAAQQEFIRGDPLRLRTATARFLFESWRLGRFVEREVGRSRTPTLLLLADGDRIIDNRGVTSVLQRSGAGLLETITYADQAHAIQLDAPERLAADVDRWITKRLTDGSDRV